MAVSGKNQQRTLRTGLQLLCITIFILTAMPRLNIKIGSLPIYVVDIFIAVTFLYVTKIKKEYKEPIPFSGYIKIIAFFAILSEFGAAIYFGSALQPIYMLMRTLLAISLFFSVSRVVKSKVELGAIIKAGLLGLIVTSVLMILTSLPTTRSYAITYVFSNPYFEPAALETVRSYVESLRAMRGRSLVGVSILSAAFINTLWPLVALLYRWPDKIAYWRKIALVGSLLAPLGVVMGYSRGGVLGLFLVVGGVLFFGSGRNRRAIIIAVLCAVTIFTFFGWESDYFFFDRLETRTRAMVENPYESEYETERLFAYFEPFEHLVENPLFLFMGEGLAAGKMASRGTLDVLRLFNEGQAATHAVFAKAYYSYGMLAAFTYMLMVVSGLVYLLRQIRIRKNTKGISSIYSQALFASLLGMLPWFVFGHAAISQPRGAMILFFLFGLLASLKNFKIQK